MKSILIYSTMLLFAFASSCATSKNDKLLTPTVQPIADIAGTANQLTSVLQNAIGLNSDQVGPMTTILSNYMTGTNDLVSLTKNMGKYTKKFTTLTNKTMKSIKGLLSIAQYTKLVNMGSGGAANIVSNMPGGDSLSPAAISVLNGLLGLK